MPVRSPRLTGLLLAPAFALLVLAGCNSEAVPAQADGAAAPIGEVLNGSISDAMLPVEGLGSQPPVAAPLPGETAAAGSGDDGKGAAEGVAEAGPAAAPSAPAPSAPAPTANAAPPTPR